MVTETDIKKSAADAVDPAPAYNDVVGEVQPISNNDQKIDETKEYPDEKDPGLESSLVDPSQPERFSITVSDDSSAVENKGYALKAVEDDSPYAEVRASVPSEDDATLPQNTLRMWVIGFLMTTIGSTANMLFSMHSPPFSISTFVTSVVAWPVGVAWARWVPQVRIFGKYGGPSLNPGPFTLKEHAVVTIMGNASFGGGTAYATDILLAMNIPHFYNRDFGWIFSLLAVWSTQCIGFSLAGLCHRVLVWPASMIWPNTLVYCTFLTNMHINKNITANGWKISRLNFFGVVGLIAFFWWWIPGYIMPALSETTIPVWIAKDNVIVNQIFGFEHGLGLFPLSFDWQAIAGYIGSPLVPPVSTIVTIGLSLIFVFWIVVPIIHYSNAWYGHYLLLTSSTTYDRYQKKYDVQRITDSNSSFNMEKYKNYSKLFLPTTFAVSYGMSFASVTATMVHAALFYGKDIWAKVRRLSGESEDVHNRLMREYKAVPILWYAITFVLFFALSIITILVWDTEMPFWALLLALAIASLFLFPIGIIMAITNMAVGLNVITEFIIGYLLPGRPIAMMFFKTFGYITNSQALTFAQDMKLGHYLKIAPRLLFVAQFFAALWSGVVQVCVLRWAEGNIKNLCDPEQSGNFTCPGATVFFNASIIWGVIGPQRMFSIGQLYSNLNWFFLIGAILPIISWLIIHKWPKRFASYGHYPKYAAEKVNWPVFFSGTGMIPPATPAPYAAFCAIGIFFGFFIRRYWFPWWAKYNYTLSASLDIGLAFSFFVVFIALLYPNINMPSWWGVTVYQDTLDAKGASILKKVPEGGYFGPESW